MNHSIHVQLHGLQRFIFASQRLKSMVGANAMIETALKAIASEGTNKKGWTELGHGGGHLTFECAQPIIDVEWIATRLDALLPGVSVSVSVSIPGANGTDQRSIARRPSHALLAPPFLQACQELAGQIAGRERTLGQDKTWVSRSFRQRLVAAHAHRKEKAKGPAEPNTAVEPPSELAELADNSYIALVKLDGNSFGDIARNQTSAQREERFKQLRTATEASVTTALDRAAEKIGTDNSQMQRYILLMHGGDDILLLTQPKMALPFVQAFAENWSKCRQRAETFAAGVVIANHKLPINRLHELASQLVDSAKRRSRSMFCVDWLVCTQAWMTDLSEQRRRDAQRIYRRGDGTEERLVLTARPMPVLRQSHSNNASLAELIEAADKIAAAERMATANTDVVARSQRRQLALDLAQSRMTGEYAWARLPSEQKKKWFMGAEDSPYAQLPYPADTWTTNICDLVEICEIPKLGRSDAGDNVPVKPTAATTP